MNLANRIERHFNKILFASITTVAVSVASFSYFEAKNNSEKAVQFIMTHVKAIAESEVNAQNVSEIDKGINLVYSTWKDTQGLEFKIRVFLDERLVAHAGQLSKLSWPMIMATKNETLPSSQALRIEVQVSLLAPVLTALLSVFLIVGFLYVSFRVLRKNVTRSVKQITHPLETRVEWLKEASSNIKDAIKAGYSVESSDITEMKDLDFSLGQLFDQISTYEKELAEKNFDEGRLRTMDIFAHNLKNILTLFQYRLKHTTALSLKDRNLFEEVFAQIQSLSNAVLESRQSSVGVTSSFILSEAIGNVIAQQRELLSVGGPVLELEAPTEQLAEIRVCGPRVEFEATITNLIKNALEATDGSGQVTLTIHEEDSHAIIKISDNGKGIPEEILPNLGQEWFTYGKIKGTGLGLFHAKSIVEKQMNGLLKIASKVGYGTIVIISLPVATRAETLLPPAIELFPGMSLVVLDDDPLIHLTWQHILADVSPQINVEYLSSAEEFQKWFSQRGPGDIGSRYYLFDYNIKSETTNGLDLIAKYNLALESMLVTGDAALPEIREAAESLGVKVVPKEFMNRIRFKVSEPSEQLEAHSVQI